MSANAELEVAYNQNTKRFSLVGPDALDHPSSKKIILNMAEIMQIVLMYNKGIFSSMLNDNITKKSVATEHRAKAELFLLAPSVEPRQSTPASSSDDDSFGSSSSTESTGSIRSNLWQTYLKLIKEQHPDLTHKQAMQLGKSGCSARNILQYEQWKKNQAAL